MKRNLINEILAVKYRSEFNSRHDYSSRLNDIEYAFNENLNYNGDFNRELLKYIPIATVACFEAFFRSVYKELIDFGKPFSENAIKFNQSKNVKFDFEIINAIQTKIVTVGEFISHILPCNNFDDINANLSTLAGVDFLEQIKKFNQESIYENINETSKEFIENSNQIIFDIKRTFELRHIFCHEFATNLKLDQDEIFRCYNSCKIFLDQINNFIWHLLYPNAPQTQSEMNSQAMDDFEKSENNLSELISTIKKAKTDNSDFDINVVLFDKSVEQWKNYRKSKADLDSSFVEGGSMYPLLYNSSLTETTKEKIESLKKEFEIDLKKYSLAQKLQ
ncbi:lysozyme inhibitor LprI family protein [Flavobacterium sp. RS13.1]|uniref:lysozyme inhibitor LprI family protein n=1 Tax=Flavobacterium sp. RS13.1 TaxID=3400345 RepID=UPI003AAC71AF